MSKKKKWLLRMICIALTCVILGAASVFGLDAYVRLSASPQILTPEQAAEIADVDCILVLGCLVKSGGVPSDMLHDRLRRGVDLYESGAAPKLLMSGDHGRDSYDEVDAMKQFAVDSGIPSTDVFMDHAGFSTYESIYRARDIFQANKIIIVSQEYHLYRAIYIAQALGLEAYGVSADYRNYLGQSARDFREVLARIKDIGYCIIKPEPTYLGESIPIFGDGDLTNDENSNFS